MPGVRCVCIYSEVSTVVDSGLPGLSTAGDGSPGGKGPLTSAEGEACWPLTSREVGLPSPLISADWTLWSSSGGGGAAAGTWITVDTNSATVGGPAARESENSRLSSTDSESKSTERESDSEPARPGGERETRSLVVKVVSGEGLPESRDRLSREAACGTAITVAAAGRPPGA